MSDLGQTLVIVPCWWDGEADSLVATIRQQRKDLFSDWPSSSSPPIEPVPPIGFFKVEHIPDVEGLMLCTSLIPNDFDPHQWWISEKYDGVRVCWNPRLRKIYGRNAREYHLPNHFISWFGSQYLDGEVWFGRASFLDSQMFVEWSGTLNSDSSAIPLPDTPELHRFRFVCFDVPLLTHSEMSFEKRYSFLQHNFYNNHPFINIIMLVRCKTSNHVNKSLQNILEHSGEGIILRERGSTYEHGRSRSLIKLKATRDQEGLVIKSGPSSVLLLLSNGDTFEIPHNTLPPKPGSIVTFAHYGTNRASDEAPFRIRRDLTWDDLLRGYHTDSTPKLPTLSGPTSYSLTLLEARRRHPTGYWTEQSNKNMRAFFDDFAKKRNLDPLVANSWHSINLDEIEREGGISILNHYGGSLIRALMDVYREIPWDELQFRKVPKHHWQSEQNRKWFFSSFAEKHGFDPLVAGNWYKTTYRMMAAEKGGVEVLRLYGHCVSKAIASIYPDIGLDMLKFHKKSQNFWDSTSNVKGFLDAFAKEKNFDPLVAENWYSVTYDDISKMRGTSPMHKYHYSLILALQDVYPDIGLDSNRFSKKPGNYWNNDDNKREFFKQFAAKRGFDPLIATNWYSVPLRLLITSDKGSKILGQYNGSAVQALCDLFYDIGVQKSGFLAKSTVV